METYNRTEIEAKVIADALVGCESIPDTRAIVNAAMFRTPGLGDLWRDIIKAWDSGNTLDENVIPTIPDKDVRKAIISSIPYAGMAIGTRNNALALQRAHASDLVMSFITRVSKLTNERVVPPSELLFEARKLVESLERNHQSKRSVKIGEAAAQLEKQLKQVKKSRDAGDLPYLPTGFRLLDHHFRGGLRGGNVMVVAARPGVGKTATILSMIASMVHFGYKVRLYSMEMPAVEIAERIMFSLDAIRPIDTRTGDFEQGKWDKAVDRLKDWGLWIEDSMSNIGDILSDAAVYHMRKECDVVFLDHLRLLRTGDPKIDSSIYARTCEITRKIKSFALQSMIPVVYACQLNRDSVREDRTPDLQDLRDSGSIEEDADRIVFLQRLKTDDGKPKLKLVIGKNRQGGGAYECTYLIPNETYSSFTETDSGEEINYETKDAATAALDDMPY